MKSIFVFLLFFSSLMATGINTHFQAQVGSDFHFDTDLQLLTDFTVSSGGSSLDSGDTVCSGDTITITPTKTTIWAVSELDIFSAYPNCGGGGGYCPAFEGTGAFTDDRQIKWLSTAVYNEQYDIGHDDVVLMDYDDEFTQDAYAALATFYEQPADYQRIVDGPITENKKAGANVFCKGKLRVYDDGVTKATNTLPLLSSTSFDVEDVGSHLLSASLIDMACFAAIVKYPLNTGSNEQWFRLYYFVYNPSFIPAQSGTDSFILNVQEESEPCDMSRVSTTVSYSDSDPESYIVRVSIKNNGDSSVNLTSVTSSDADYTATLLSPAACTAFGWPTSWCSASIGSGNTRYVSVSLHDDSPPNSGSTTLTINGVSSAAGCGDPGACSITVPLTNDVFCEMVPSSIDIPQFTQSRFNVSCTRLDHTTIACTGTNWTLSPSTFGTLADKTNDHALLTPDDPPGSHGTIRYDSTNLAYCTAGVDVLPAANIPVSCAIAPPAVSFGPGEIVPFTVTCTNSLGAVIPCVGSDWSWAGLSGGFVPGQIDNTHAHAYLDPASVVGTVGKLVYISEQSICESNVTVIDARVTCDLTPDVVVMNQSTLQHFNFTCTLDGNPVIPADADYTIIPPLGGSLGGDSPTGVDYTSPAFETEGDVFAAGNVTVPGSPVIGAIDTSHILVPSLTTAINCIIEPSEFAYGPGEVAMFLVDCTNIVGASVPCVGANWYWGDGLTGNFIEGLTDNERAFASPSSSIGSVGKLFYESGEAICFSNITIVAPVFICDLTPNIVTLNFTTTQHFDFVCTAQGAIMEPTGADYYLQDGLVGSLSGETIDGVDYTSPAFETEGDLLGFGCFVGDCVDPEPGVLLGAQDISRITVTNSTEDLCVGPNCDEGDSAYCSILGPDFLVYSPGQTDWIGIMCGEDADTPCSSISWSITPTTGYIVSSDDTGVRFTITGFPGLSGEITAMVDADHGCSKTFTINSPSCWAYT